MKTALRRSRGQAMTEYVATSFILIVGALAVTTVTPVLKLFMDALQDYVDLFFYALNLAVG